LINLVSNAVKFTSEGNSINISAKRKKIKDFKVMVYITVHDSGIGIP